MTLKEFSLYNWRGGGGSMWFAPVSQARGSETLKQMSLTKQILGKYGLDYSGEFIVGMRDMHHIVDVLYDKTNPEQVKAAYQCFDELLTIFSAQGIWNLSGQSGIHGQGGRHIRPGAAQSQQDSKKSAGPKWNPGAGEIGHPA